MLDYCEMQSNKYRYYMTIILKSGRARGVTVIVVGNGHGDAS